MNQTPLEKGDVQKRTQMQLSILLWRMKCYYMKNLKLFQLFIRWKRNPQMIQNYLVKEEDLRKTLKLTLLSLVRTNLRKQEEQLTNSGRKNQNKQW